MRYTLQRRLRSLGSHAPSSVRFHKRTLHVNTWNRTKEDIFGGNTREWPVAGHWLHISQTYIHHRATSSLSLARNRCPTQPRHFWGQHYISTAGILPEHSTNHTLEHTTLPPFSAVSLKNVATLHQWSWGRDPGYVWRYDDNTVDSRYTSCRYPYGITLRPQAMLLLGFSSFHLD